jgi:hypothetical protein
MTIKIILKSGVIIPIKCNDFMLEKDSCDNPKSYEFEGIKENNPVWLNWDDVSAVIRVVSDEKTVTTDDI